MSNSGQNPQRQREEASIQVPAKGGGPKDQGPEPQYPDEKREEDEEELVDMTEEDRRLKESLEEALEDLKNEDTNKQDQALELMRTEIQQSTSSMTGVPRPLKFLLPHYEELKDQYKKLNNQALKKKLADIISVVATVADRENRDCLQFRLLGDKVENIGQWGHEYLKHLAAQIGEEYDERLQEDQSKNVNDLLQLVHEIVPYNMQHNAEAEAIDLLLETGELKTLLKSNLVDEHNRERVSLYLLRCGEYLSNSEDTSEAFEVAFEIFMQQKQYANALRVVLRLSVASGSFDTQKTKDLVTRVYNSCQDNHIRQQMSLMLAKHHFKFETGDEVEDSLNRNERLKQYFDSLSRELDTVAPKTPEDIYKSHLSETASLALRDEDESGAQVESARGNLASSFVNGFVNCCYGTDTLMSPDNSEWIARNKDDFKLSAAASLGLLHMWNPDEISAPDKYLQVDNDYVQAGALLSIGLICTGIAPEDDLALSLLEEYVSFDGSPNTSQTQRRTAILGLGLAYAGSGRDDVVDLIYPYVQEIKNDVNIDTVCIAGLSVGLVLVGSANDEAAAVIADRLMECSETELSQPMCRHLVLGLALLYLGQGEAAEAMQETLDAVPTVIYGEEAEAEETTGDHNTTDGEQNQKEKCVDKPAYNLIRFAKVLLTACAYAGTGDVLTIQKLLHICAEHPQAEAESAEKSEQENEESEGQQQQQQQQSTSQRGGGIAGLGGAAAAAGAAGSGEAQEGEQDDRHTIKPAYLHQSAAVLGLALVSMGEPLSVDMMARMADHLLQYGDPSVKRAVPLALSLCHVSDPEFSLIDILSKLTHDNDPHVAQNAILSMGICGAGTNNSRIAGLLRQLASFYAKDASPLFITRVAQGLLHTGKGLLTMNPFHSDRLLMNRSAVAGLLIVALCGIDLPSTLHSQWHWLLYALTPAISPRMLITVDSETLNPINIEVRVGQATETVGQAGKPKTITGFQTHKTPVLLGANERAEIVDTDTYTALAPVLEGVVLVKKSE
eukprot:gb/GECG01008741.1/.p1 GENE.gb/GECG01008741.1/~~gb/GECG01008741.1/.p1  ORF type:complete len:1012 (+),score=153.11 gb/GECG01008741.1/:1-3036(+)